MDGKGCGFRKGVEEVKASVWVYIDDLYHHDVAISCMSSPALSLFDGDVWHGVTALPWAVGSKLPSKQLSAVALFMAEPRVRFPQNSPDFTFKFEPNCV